LHVLRRYSLNSDPGPGTRNPDLNMAIAYLGIGSNLGDKRENCERAIRKLAKIEGIRLDSKSELYCTKPVGGPPQEDYINGTVGIRTEIPPKDLLRILKNIEQEIGRVPSEKKNFPRVIDIDILLYDDEVIETEGLVVPHPRMHERSFVLRGLSEIAPEAVHPAIGKTISELYKGQRNESEKTTES